MNGPVVLSIVAIDDLQWIMNGPVVLSIVVSLSRKRIAELSYLLW